MVEYQTGTDFAFQLSPRYEFDVRLSLISGAQLLHQVIVQTLQRNS
jgi:hypothetical protein